MSPNELEIFLNRLIENQLYLSTMIWGPPGIGKSSIVNQVTQNNGLEFIDLRLSQLAPTDLRGLPVPKNNQSAWLPPEFLPMDGKGILFLDEINMAPPTMQGVAQQLILDRRVGSYKLPEKWFVWAAGNRKEDQAAIFDMPSPLANRFVHLKVEVSAVGFRHYAHTKKFDEQLIAFISFREDLLYKIIKGENAWPSPRSWEMANSLLSVNLDISPAVGVGPASEFYAFKEIADKTPDLDKVALGDLNIKFPEEPSLRYASVMGLVGRCSETKRTINCFQWLVNKAPAEWIQLFATDLFPLLRKRNMLVPVHQALTSDPKLLKFLSEFSQLLGEE